MERSAIKKGPKKTKAISSVPLEIRLGAKRNRKKQKTETCTKTSTSRGRIQLDWLCLSTLTEGYSQ